MISIEKAFNTDNKNVFEYFQRPGVGFYIPLYQREYSWDKDNIDQLLEDITKGVENLVEGEENEIRFMGTIITVVEREKNNIQPQDVAALPTSIEKIIDGQQRLSTFALLSALLLTHICDIERKIIKALKKEEEGNEMLEEVREICNYWRDKLYDIFSVDLKRGKPTKKPKIIRGSVDKWSMVDDDENYPSPVANYLFQFLSHLLLGAEMPKFSTETNAGKNLKNAHGWIRNIVLQATDKPEEFPPADSIIKHYSQEQILQYPRERIERIILSGKHEKGSLGYHYCSLVQIFAVCHYLLDRCCFTIIQPIDDNWAFDMFQSLNATGTPLTAIETFKPLVVNLVNMDGRDFKNSTDDKYFTKIENALGNSNTAAQKSKLTKDLITSFALPCEGKKLSTHFSKQKKWLEKVYSQDLAEKPEKRQDFIKLFGNYSEFYDLIWKNYSGKDEELAPKLGSRESDLVSLLLLYLIESNHKMAITFLAPCYHKVVEGEENSISDFNKLVKLLAGFYTLWRASRPNSGLDDVYRSFFRGSKNYRNEGHNWIKNDVFDLNQISSHIQNVIEIEGISDKDQWKAKALNYLRLNKAKNVCKFALYVTSNDTILDQSNPGLMKVGSEDSNPFLSLKKWNSPALRTIEHIAPVKNTSNWSAGLYDDENWYQSIGNLTLLPANINTSMSNRGWKEKYLYYMFLSEKDLDKATELTNLAESANIKLNAEILEILRQSPYNSHIRSIVAIGENGSWDKDLVKDRTERMLDILYDRVSPWIWD